MTWFSVGIEIDLVFGWGGMQNRLVFRVGIKIYLTSVLGSELTWFCVGDRNRLGFGVILKLTVFV